MYSQLRLLSYFVVAIIFTPQIVSLFYKSATKRRFVFRCIFYSCLLLTLVVFTPYVCFLLRPISNIFYWVELVKLIVFTTYLFIIWLVFTLVKKESLCNYLRYTFLEPLKGVAITLPVSFIFGALGILLFKGFNLVSPLTTFAITVTTIILYYILFALIPSIKNYYYINFFNERCLYNLKINYKKFEI